MANSCDHDDLLFLSMLNTGFPGLLHLGEMAISDNPDLRDFRKVVLHNSIKWLGSEFEFLLPTHKSDTTFKGNHVHIAQIIDAPTQDQSWLIILSLVANLSPFTLSSGSMQMDLPQPIPGSFIISGITALLILLANPCEQVVLLHLLRLVLPLN